MGMFPSNYVRPVKAAPGSDGSDMDRQSSQKQQNQAFQSPVRSLSSSHFTKAPPISASSYTSHSLSSPTLLNLLQQSSTSAANLDLSGSGGRKARLSRTGGMRRVLRMGEDSDNDVLPSTENIESHAAEAPSSRAPDSPSRSTSSTSSAAVPTAESEPFEQEPGFPCVVRSLLPLVAILSSHLSWVCLAGPF